jgi:hypothetical protein
MSVLKSAVRRAAILTVGLIAGCTVVVEDDYRPGPRPDPGPAFCTREYAPVCGRRGGRERTFSNACMADAAGFRVVGYGECSRFGGDEPRFCTREYRPVCAVRRGVTRTFPNACEARSADYRIIDRGPC